MVLLPNTPLTSCLSLFLPCLASGLPNQYLLVKKLGEGAEGEVWLADDTRNHMPVAIKLVPRGSSAWKYAMVGREAEILLLLSRGKHVNVTLPVEFILTTDHIGIVMEYVAGGSLADYVNENPLDEEQACYFFRQLIGAVEYCHSQNIAYRDVKLLNALLTKHNPPRLKLCDFGLAKKWESGAPIMMTLAGTPGFMPPQILGGLFTRDPISYDAVKADVWMCGALLTVMLARHFPFDYDRFESMLSAREAMEAVWNRGKVHSWRESTSAVKKMSEEVKDLLDKMLEPDEEKRIGIQDIKSHPWFNMPLPAKYQEALDVMVKEQTLSGANTEKIGDDELVKKQEKLRVMMSLAEKASRGAKKTQMRLALAQLPPLT